MRRMLQNCLEYVTINNANYYIKLSYNFLCVLLSAFGKLDDVKLLQTL